MISNRMRRNFRRRRPISEGINKFISSQRFKRLFKGAVAITSILIIFFSWRIFYHELLNAPFLKIKEINIRGIKKVSRNEVMELMDVKIGDNIIAFSVNDIERRVKKHPWVNSIDVRRKMPDRLFVDVKEREPFALINSDALYLIDGRGTMFERLSINDDVDLPVITIDIDKEELGEDEKMSSLIIDAMSLIEMLKEKEPFGLDDLSEVKIDRVYGMTLYTMGEVVRIEIGFDDFEDKILRLERVVREIGGSLLGVSSVNLNYEKGVVVKFKNRKNELDIKKGGDNKWARRTI